MGHDGGEGGEAFDERPPHLFDIGHRRVERFDQPLRLVAELGELLGARPDPVRDHLGVGLNVELRSPGGAAGAEGLMRIPGGGGEQDRPGRQLSDLVVVPLQDVGRERYPGEQRVAVGDVAARSCPPRQTPRVGTRWRTALRSRPSSTGNQVAPGLPSPAGYASCGPPSTTTAEYSSTPSGSGSSACGRTVARSSPAAVSQSPSRRASSAAEFSTTSVRFLPSVTSRGYRRSLDAGLVASGPKRLFHETPDELISDAVTGPGAAAALVRSGSDDC